MAAIYGGWKYDPSAPHSNPLTPPSASADDEQLRKKIIGSLSRAQVQNVDVMGEATIEREADHIMRAVSHHTKEAERRARIDERNSVALDNYRGHTFSATTDWKGKFQKFIDNNEKRLADLSSKAQKRGV